MKTFLQYFLLLTISFLATKASAASLYIDPPFNELNRGDAVTLSIRLDVDEDARECINAVDAELTYPANIEPVDVSTGNSIFNVWVEPPTLDKENRLITFAGGIPNGYCGRVEGDPMLTNVLAQIIFRSPGLVIGANVDDISKATVEFTDRTTAYLNDGRGTKANLRTLPASFNLNERPGSTIENPWKEAVDADDIPPEEFSIALEKDTRAFAQKYFIVFSTTDKQTGVDHYEVIEEPISKFGAFEWGRADAPWIVARSPYVLKDQSLNSVIRVKAIDKAGNEYIATLLPEESMRSMSADQMLVFILGFAGLVLLMVVFALIGFFLRKRKKREDTIEDIPQEQDEDFEKVQPETEYVDTELDHDE